MFKSIPLELIVDVIMKLAAHMTYHWVLWILVLLHRLGVDRWSALKCPFHILSITFITLASW